MTPARLAVLALALAGCPRAEVKPDPPVNEAPPPGKTNLLAGMVLPPSEAGGFNTSVAGCAATPEVEPPATRAAPPDEKVEASGVATGLILTHTVSHACCLAAKTAVEVTGGKVQITESLAGTPCRCRCSSTIRTAVGLKPGDYAVEVKTVEPSRTRVAWTGNVTVK